VAEQPWRNPRPAPHLPEMQPHLHKLLIPAWLRAWWPAVVWACVIFTLSTDSFSSEHTATVLSFLVKWLFPHLTQAQFNFIHHIIRKSAHFTEYFIFCILIYRGVRGDRKAGAGPGASPPCPSPQAIQSWMKSIKPSSPAAPPHPTIPCSTPSAPSSPSPSSTSGSASAAQNRIRLKSKFLIPPRLRRSDYCPYFQ